MKKYILMMLLSFLLPTKGKAGYYVFINESVSWTEARSICQSEEGDTLLGSREDINNTCTRQYLQKPARYWMGFYSILTPYISHHGCYQIIDTLDADHSTTIAMIIPSVGTCFGHCHNYQWFGIMNDICICLDEPETEVLPISKVNRNSCNISCNAFQEKEYCGGLNEHLNLYQISMIIENGPSDNRCVYLDCPGSVGAYHQVECTKGLLGRVCENVIEHRDYVTYQEARSKCGQWYLNFEHACDSNEIQANVKYWVDVKKYQIPKRVTGHHEFHDFHIDIPDLFSCLFYDTSKNKVSFGNCSMLNYAICETDTVSSDEYPYCSMDRNETNDFRTSTERENLESHNPEIDITKVTDCLYCSSNNGGASSTLVSTESSQIRTMNKELDTETIWGPILGIVIVIGCVVGGVVFYRYRCRASEAKQYEKSQKYDTEDPNRNYFVLEAKTSQSNAGGTAKKNYDNVNAQCTIEKESVYAEQPDTVYDHLGKHRHLKLAQVRVTSDIYADGSTNAAADIGDYNTLNDTYRQREALSIIQDEEGYGHLDNVVSNRNVDSDYDHC